MRLRNSALPLTCVALLFALAPACGDDGSDTGDTGNEALPGGTLGSTTSMSTTGDILTGTTGGSESGTDTTGTTTHGSVGSSEGASTDESGSGTTSSGEESGGNQIPTANPQMLRVEGETAITLSGTDPDGDPLTFAITVEPMHGELSGEGANLVYTPRPGYAGADSFEFRVSDGLAESASATVELEVVNNNVAPTAQDSVLRLDEDTSRSFELVAEDPNGDELRVDILGQPEHGELTSEGGLRYTYTPKADFSGDDRIVFQVFDGIASSDTAEVKIHVAALDDAGQAEDQHRVVETNEVLDLVLTGYDPEGDELDFRIDARPSHGSVSVPNRVGRGRAEVRYTPEEGFRGQDTFTYTVSNSGGSSRGTITIDIGQSGDQPHVDSQDINHASGNLTIDIDPINEDGSVAQANIVVPPLHGRLAANRRGAYTYQPDPGFSGKDEFAIRPSNDEYDGALGLVEIDIGSANRPPTAVDFEVWVESGEQVDIRLQGDDPDGDPVRFKVLGKPRVGELSGEAPQLSYRNTGSGLGTTYLTYIAKDDDLQSEVATVTIHLIPDDGGGDDDDGGDDGSIPVRRVIYVSGVAKRIGGPPPAPRTAARRVEDGRSWETAYSNLNDALAAARSLGTVEEIWLQGNRIYTPFDIDECSLDIPDFPDNTDNPQRRPAANIDEPAFSLVDGVSIIGGFNGDETSAGDRLPTCLDPAGDDASVRDEYFLHRLFAFNFGGDLLNLEELTQGQFIGTLVPRLRSLFSSTGVSASDEERRSDRACAMPSFVTGLSCRSLQVLWKPEPINPGSRGPGSPPMAFRVMDTAHDTVLEADGVSGVELDNLVIFGGYAQVERGTPGRRTEDEDPIGGGGLRVINESNVTLNDVTTIYNLSDAPGGGMMVGFGSVVTGQQVNVLLNASQFAGGGISTESSTFDVSELAVSANYAWATGAGLNASNSIIQIDNAEFWANQLNFGPAVGPGDPNPARREFGARRFDRRGSAIALQPGTEATIDNARIFRNSLGLGQIMLSPITKLWLNDSYLNSPLNDVRADQHVIPGDDQARDIGRRPSADAIWAKLLFNFDGEFYAENSVFHDGGKSPYIAPAILHRGGTLDMNHCSVAATQQPELPGFGITAGRELPGREQYGPESTVRLSHTLVVGTGDEANCTGVEKEDPQDDILPRPQRVVDTDDPAFPIIDILSGTVETNRLMTSFPAAGMNGASYQCTEQATIDEHNHADIGIEDLVCNSPAINAGVFDALTTPDTDILGRTRQGSPPDIGAHEYELSDGKILCR